MNEPDNDHILQIYKGAETERTQCSTTYNKENMRKVTYIANNWQRDIVDNIIQL